MQCPTCGEETRHTGTSETLVGYYSEDGHDHDDNCQKRFYRCVNGHSWHESIVRRCSDPTCGWRGKTSCFCHVEPKVEAWSDPEDYLTDGALQLYRKIEERRKVRADRPNDP